MNKKAYLNLTTALAFVVHACPAMALPVVDNGLASVDDAAKSDKKDEVVVVGIRGSVTTAVDKKKKSKQIVDSVVSEDVGKLPDNNVVEAMSRITGVQITRERGQGQSVAIRGLDGVQTTINGNNTNLGTGRNVDLSLIPAELLKSVDVYKTRTADQVEGSIAGTVNVQLRRPFDLPKKWTVAGSVRGAYDDISKKVSPYGSLIVANRFDTGIGEVGFLINGSLTKTKYLETYIESESPDTVCCAGYPDSALGKLPANLKDIIVPYRAFYGSESGAVTRRSLNTVLQWKPQDNLEFVLEGGYIGSREGRQADRLYAQMQEYGETLTDIELQPDGTTVRKLTVSQAARPPIGVDSLYSKIKSDLYLSNFETHWTGDRVKLDASAQYNWSNTSQYNVEMITRPYSLTSATIDFTNPIAAPTITLNNADLTDPAVWSVERFQDLIFRTTNKEFVGQANMELTLSDEGLFRTFQMGTRYSHRDTGQFYGYRDGYPRTGRRVNGLTEFTPQSEFPGASQASLADAAIGSQQWLRIPGEVLYDNIAAIRQYMIDKSVINKDQFASVLPPEDRSQDFTSSENTFAVYGQINYAFDIGIPIDGVAGIRYVNTWGGSNGYAYRDIDGVANVTPVSGHGNFIDVLPSVTATLHFTQKAQLRLSYTTNVQRPSFYALRPFSRLDPTVLHPTVDAGNPDLKAQREYSFNASGEYYFGRGGLLSLAGYYKKASNFLYGDTIAIADLSAYGLPGVSGYLSQQRNAGDGTFIGVEGNAQSFFDFLPGMLRNFGASVNASYIAKARVEYPIPEDFPGAYDSVNTSKMTANATLFYDTPKFSSRVAFNYRSPYRMFIWYTRPDYSWYSDDTYRLDAAINYSPVKYATLSLEATNLTGNDQYTYFGKNNLLPRGVRLQARTFQASLRFRL